MLPELQTGMRVSIFIPHLTEENIKRTLSLSSIVEELPDDDYVLIHMPTYRGYVLPLPNDPILMRFFFESEPYSLQVLFVERITRGKFTLAKMRRLSPVERHQMRENFRLSCHLPITVERETDEADEETVFKGTTLDIGEGGMLLLTDANIERNETISVTVDIGEKEKIKAIVLRVHEVTNGKYRYKAALRFIIKHSSQSDRLYKYIVSQQLAKRRRRDYD